MSSKDSGLAASEDTREPWWKQFTKAFAGEHAERFQTLPQSRGTKRDLETRERVEQRMVDVKGGSHAALEDLNAWIARRTLSGRLEEDLNDAEYDVLIKIARDASRRYTGVDAPQDVTEAAVAMRSSMSLKIGESQPVRAERGTFDPLIPDVGKLQASGLLAESRHFARKRYKSSSDPNVQTVRRHWFRFALTEARTSVVRPLVGNSLDAALIEEDLWINFASFLARRVQGSTCGQYISLLKRWHKSITGWDPIASAVTDMVMLKQTLGGIRAELPSKNRKRFAHPSRLFRVWRTEFDSRTQLGSVMEVEPTDLRRFDFTSRQHSGSIWRAAMQEANQSLVDLKYIIASAVMTASLMRISEAAPALADQYLITRADVKFYWREDGKLDKVGIMMKPLKKKGNPPKVEVVLASSNTGNIRAAFLVWLIFFLDPVPESEESKTPLFRNWSWEEKKPGAVLSQSQFQSWYSSKMEKSGIAHWRHYSLHSFRIGGATILLAAGVSALQIAAMGRWDSTTYEIYTRPTREQMLQASSAMDSVDATTFEDADDEFFDRAAGVGADHEADMDAVAAALATPAEADPDMIPEDVQE